MSTLEIFFFGRTVYNVLSVEDWNGEYKTLKSAGWIAVPGRPPSLIPITVVTPATVRECLETVLTLAKLTVESPALVKETVLPSVAIPIKLKSVVVTVLIPPDAAVILTKPTLASVDGLTSALKVPAVPTLVRIDFTFSVPYDVVATDILVSSIPSKIKDSPSLNFPLVL